MAAPSQFKLPGETRSPIILRVGFWACVLIGAGAVVLRLIALSNPTGRPQQMASLDTIFASHTVLTLSHIVPAILFVLISPFAVFARFAHLQWPLRMLFPTAAIVGLTAYAMNVYAIGGWTERIVILIFNTWFLYALVRAFRHWRRADAALTRRWLLRAIAAVLGVATARPVMGVFFATSPLTHLEPRQFFGIAMAVGFSVNVIVFEVWLRSLARRAHSSQTSTAPVLTVTAPISGGTR
ncbi:MAG TPA: DUF2306 domain-containing protein [Terracidiphilus sp.]|nr:DUF2306 domain-containing protein [Terracidiphilus sp.]